mmetsp:Transcript_65092/g.179873  ORF Transcript_65092/g.179873 Transcript_65092/m.179873 type:complete len:254 (-) Transcript_65092:38-799(-)
MCRARRSPRAPDCAAARTRVHLQLPPPRPPPRPRRLCCQRWWHRQRLQWALTREFAPPPRRRLHRRPPLPALCKRPRPRQQRAQHLPCPLSGPLSRLLSGLLSAVPTWRQTWHRRQHRRRCRGGDEPADGADRSRPPRPHLHPSTRSHGALQSPHRHRLPPTHHFLPGAVSCESHVGGSPRPQHCRQPPHRRLRGGVASSRLPSVPPSHSRLHWRHRPVVGPRPVRGGAWCAFPASLSAHRATPRQRWRGPRS